jgi:hypothetical protein
MGHLMEEGILGLDVKSLHDHQEHSQANRHRRIEEMEGDCEGELDAREDFYGHGCESAY